MGRFGQFGLSIHCDLRPHQKMTYANIRKTAAL